MERTKRPQPDTILDRNNNKKLKLQDSSTVTINTNKSLFEDLANETVYEILDHLDIYHAYKAFFSLNKRFRNLFLYSNLPIQVNISTMSRLTFRRYHKNIIVPNKHRINYLRLSNPFTVDIIFSPPRIIAEFVQLKTLVLDQISVKYLRNIFTHATRLRQLRSLVLKLAEGILSPSKIFNYIFRLPALKSCKITYQTKGNQRYLPSFISQFRRSSIEYLVIDGRVPYNSLHSLLFHVPKLRHLSINTLVGCYDFDPDLEFISLNSLEYVSFTLENVRFTRLEHLITNLFRRVEVFRLTTQYNQAYLDAQRWEQLILSYMPNLRQFDLHHDGSLRDDPLFYHDLIHRFDSPFWIERGWFFTHQHDWQRHLDCRMFYSTEPYRRQDYQFSWESTEQLCPHVYETNLNSVKHVHVLSSKANASSINYFPNATELTIKHYFQTPDDSISTTLNRIVPLQQLTKLVLQYYNFPLEEVIKLICYTPNLDTFTFDFSSIQKYALDSIRQSEIYQNVSKTNRIKNLEVNYRCKLEEIRFIMKLFPQMEYFKTAIHREEIESITRQLLANENNQIRRLFYICFTRIPKICLQELDRLFKREKLVVDYLMKFINRDLYLWW